MHPGYIFLIIVASVLALLFIFAFIAGKKRQKIFNNVKENGTDGIGIFLDWVSTRPQTRNMSQGNYPNIIHLYEHSDPNTLLMTPPWYADNDIPTLRHMQVFPIKIFEGKAYILPETIKSTERLNRTFQPKSSGIRSRWVTHKFNNPFFSAKEIRELTKDREQAIKKEEELLYSVLGKIESCDDRTEMLAMFDEHKHKFTDDEQAFILEQIEVFSK